MGPIREELFLNVHYGESSESLEVTVVGIECKCAAF